MQTPSPTTRVLLVEDNPGDARLMQVLSEIAKLPVEFVHCASVSAAIERLGDEKLDAGLVDLGLPDAQGVEAVRRIHAAAPDLAKVVLTAQNDETLAVESLKEGAQDYLVKGNITANLLWRSLRYAMERQRVQLELVNLSLVDDLTGLYNRKGFLALAEHRLKLAYRTGEPFLVVFADLDGLKKINDTWGHQEGNRALVDAARILKDSFRQSDILARLGGDEFAAFIADAGEGSTNIVRQRVRSKLDFCRAGSERPYDLSFSIGIIPSHSTDHSDIETLLGLADALMYQEKRNKRQARGAGAGASA
jgi:two-component system, cell cycle response regulator